MQPPQGALMVNSQTVVGRGVGILVEGKGILLSFGDICL